MLGHEIASLHRISLHNFSLVKPFQLMEVAWCDSGHGKFVPTQASSMGPWYSPVSSSAK